MIIERIQTLRQSLNQLHSQNPFSEIPLPQYDDIVLNEEETQEALRKGREEKYYQLKREEYARKVNEPIQYLRFTAEELFDELKLSKTYNDKDFKFDNPNWKAIALDLCYYFTGDSRFTGDLNKGLALFGNVGSGKTALMQFFRSNQVMSYRVKSILEIQEEYKSDGESGVSHYKKNAITARNEFGLNEYGYCFDDIGTEEIPARHYAETKNIFAEIFQLRSLSVPLNSTHITSNKDAKDMLEMYGSRTYDRMKEMFNVIVFEGIESFRS